MRKLLKVLSVFVFLFLVASSLQAQTNFYRENRNGKGFVLQVDPDTNIETVYNFSKDLLFLAPKAQRIAVLPTAGWGEVTSNKTPLGTQLPAGIRSGDLNGVITLRVFPQANRVVYRVVSGASKVLHTIIDDTTSSAAVRYDIGVSQFMGSSRDQKRIYVFLSNYRQEGAVLFRLELVANNLVQTRVRFQNGETDNWVNSLVNRVGNMGTAHAIDVNAASDDTDLVVFQPNRNYSLQHVWDAAKNNGHWGINYLLDHNAVFKARPGNPLARSKINMDQIFDVAVDLGDAHPDSLQYMRGYYNHGTTIFRNNVDVNMTYPNLYYSIEMDGGPEVEIRDGSPDGAVLKTMRVNPNPVIIGHNYTGYYNLACQNALTGTELIVYEPIYRVNRNAILANEITDNDRNNVPDHIDNDGKDKFAYRNNFLINSSASLPASDRGKVLHSDYELDFIIAHRFPLAGKTANDVFTYREHQLERDPSTDPASLMPGAVVHIRVGNVFHRNPDFFQERNQFGWDDQPGNNLWIWVGNPGQAYNNPNPSKRCAGYPSPCTWAEADPSRSTAFNLTTAQYRNAGRILGVEIKNTSYATADYFGVVGNDEWASGQGDLYFLSRQYGKYIAPRIVDSNNTLTPPVTGYGRWWEFHYDRETYFGVSRNYWIGDVRNTEWINAQAFFIGRSVFSQMVYNINCGCRGARYTNFKPVFEASAPILDFSLVNIGAPPYVDGVIAPTIVANQTDTIVDANVPVHFQGGWADPSNLLVGSENVTYRFVILDDAFQDDDPHLSPKLVVDSLVETGGMLSSPNWSYVFTSERLDGRKVATFSVYLGIKFKAQDYDSIDYPYYSWWDIPQREYFAWSNSNGGQFYDGSLHGLFGAPLRITVDTRGRTSTDVPLIITRMKAVDKNGNLSGSTFNIEQGASFTIRIEGEMQLLGDIPDPRESNFEEYGGIKPDAENFQVKLLSGGNQRDQNGVTFNANHERFLKDLQNIEYHLYVRAKFLPGPPPEDSIDYTETKPSFVNESIYAAAPTRDINLLQGHDHENFQWIASGTLVSADHQVTAQNAIALFKSSHTKVQVTPKGPAPRRVFNFKIDTDEIALPVPLQARNFFGANDPSDKYEFRVAFRFPTAKWEHVTVKDHNSGVLTNSYNATPDPEKMIVRSSSSNGAQRLYVNVVDNKPPIIDGFDFEPFAYSGDPMPVNSKSLELVDNNPNDFYARGWTAPKLYWIYSIGNDQYLSLKPEMEDDLGFDFANRSSPGLYKIADRIIPLGDTYWRHSEPIVMNQVSRELPTFPDARVQTVYRPAMPVVITARSESAPMFNGDDYAMQWFLSEGTGSGPAISAGSPVAQITDANNNMIAPEFISGTTLVKDNDPPNLRLFVEDNTGLDIMVEVTGGLVDPNSLSDRTLTVVNLRQRGPGAIIYRSHVATSTAHDSQLVLTETYDLAQISSGMPGHTVVRPLTPAGSIPVTVDPDDRVTIRAIGFDSSSSNELPAQISINTETPVSATGETELVFRRGVSGDQYTITAAVADSAGHRVVIELPIIVGDGNQIRIRALERQRQKQ